MNVYGRDCYIESGWGYYVSQKEKGTKLNFKGNYTRRMNGRSCSVKRNMRLVFLKNAPKSGTIKVERADGIWSSDFCHPGQIGSFIYAREYNNALSECLGL